jgi:putative ABC transport system permease protein
MRVPALPFSLKMAWRETRGSWQQFVFFLVCVAIGVGSVVGIELFATNVESMILGDARSLLGGDLEIRLARPLGEAGETVLTSIRDRNIEVTHVRELAGMSALQGSSGSEGITRNPLSRTTQLVELKVVEPNYPLYGQVELSPIQSLHALLSPAASCPDNPCFGIVVQESLLITLGIEVGSHIKIGQAWFEIRGLLLKEPDRVASAFSLGPRVMISVEALEAAELVQVGSRIRQRYLLRVPESMLLGPLQGELQGRLAKEGARVSSFREAQPRIRKFLEQLTTYLGLIGLTALFVGGIGIACTIQGFMKQKMTTVAILKTLGADAGMIMRVYLGQSVLMGCLGSLIGAIMGIGIQIAIPLLLGGLIPVAVVSTVTFLPLLKGLVLGVATTLLFTLWPLLTIRTVPPALVFRREVEQGHPLTQQASFWKTRWLWLVTFWRDRQRFITSVAIGVGLMLLAMWQARSVTLGLVFILAFAAALVILQLGVWLLLKGLRTLPRPRSFVVRQALGSVQRPGSYTVGMAVAIGIGVMIIVTVALVKASLLASIGDRIPQDAPTFFFIDIQPDQKSQFEQIIHTQTPTATYKLTPVVRTRIGSIDGKAINPEEHKGKRNGWYFTREYVLTALADLPEDNTVVKGQWWQADQSSGQASVNNGPLRMSVEDEAARNLGLNLGTTVEFDIQGAPLPAVVESTRKVDWGSFSTNFFMILAPGSLDGAPLTYISTAKVNPDEEIHLQQALVRSLPNVTAIKIGDVLANVARLLEQLAWAIQGMALLSIISGAVVMVAALSSTRYRRLYESAILKAIGGTRQLIVQSFAIEFAVVGGLAGVIGVGLASALSWAILHFFLDLSWDFQPTVLGWALFATIGLAVIVGFLSTFRVLGEPPLAVLRQE